MNPLPATKPPEGVTLVEACSVVAITAVLAAMVAPAFHRMLDAHRVDGVASQLASDLMLARTEALARQETVRFSMQPAQDGHCYVVHTGPAGACSCLARGPAVCSEGAHAIRTVQLASADRIQLDSNVSSLLFDPRRGTATPAATLRVAGAYDRAVHAVVNILGRIRTCSPGAAVLGYVAC